MPKVPILSNLARYWQNYVKGLNARCNELERESAKLRAENMGLRDENQQLHARIQILERPQH